MRRTTTFALAAAGSALVGAGGLRADDASQAATKTSGSIVLAAGDKAHGILRGGETNELRVHLAKGDVYTFSVTSQKRGDPLVMHLTLLDTDGNEANQAARVVHYAGGKKITVGPYVVPKTGTYTIQLLAQTWFDGDYFASSKLHTPRVTRVALPTDGTSVPVDVAAGSKMKLVAKSGVASVSMTTPSDQPATLASTDDLTVALRATGVSSAETGTYQFAAKGGATLQITRPKWQSKTVFVPRLPDDPTRLAQFDYVLNWQPRVSAAQVQATAQPTSPPAAVGNPVAVDAPTSAAPSPSGATTATLFVGGAITAAATFTNHTMASDPSSSSDSVSASEPATPPASGSASTPPSDPATPPVSSPDSKYYIPPRPAGYAYGQTPPSRTTDAGTPMLKRMSPIYVGLGCVGTLGTSAFAGGAGYSANYGMRDGPWTDQLLSRNYPNEVVSALTPPAGVRTSILSTEHGDNSDPFVKTTYQVSAIVFADHAYTQIPWGQITTTMRYYIDGHQSATLLDTGGNTTVTWTVSGSGDSIVGASGVSNQTPWTIDGSWTMVMTPVADPAVSGVTTCSLTGTETYKAGSVSETVNVPMLTAQPILWGFGDVNRYFYDTVGTVTNTLSAPDSAVQQTFERTFDAPILWWDVIDRWKVIEAKTTTIDDSTSSSGVEDEESYVLVLC